MDGIQGIEEYNTALEVNENTQFGNSMDGVDSVRRSPMYAVLLAERRRVRDADADKCSSLLPTPKRIRSCGEEVASSVSPARAPTDMSRARSRSSTRQVAHSNRTRPGRLPTDRASSAMSFFRRQTADVIRNLEVYSTAELEDIDKNFQFEIPDLARLRTVTEEAVVKMNLYQNGERACGVCEILHEVADISEQELSPQILEVMRKCLAIPEGSNIPPMIIEQYDASGADSSLRGLLLYPPAIRLSPNGVVLMDICRICTLHLSCSSETKPPTLSIANGNYIGRMPEKYAALTRTDEQSIALEVPCVSLSTLTGGACKVLKSHHYIVKNTEGPIVDMIPRDLTGTVRVTMVGAMTSAQHAACRRRYELNVPLCRDALKFLVENNKLYQKQRSRINLNADSFVDGTRTAVVIDRTSASDNPLNDERITTELRDDSTYSRFGSTVPEGSDSSIEETEISSSKILVEQHGSTVDVLVRKSNAYSNTRNWESVTEMFPTLFPGGCGGPDEGRLRKLSLRKWILRCLRLPGHLFERHYAFLLLAFDFIALQNARRALYIKLKVSTAALVAGNISREKVLLAVQYYNHITASRERGVKPDSPPDSIKEIIDLRKELNSGESASFGSDMSRMRGRHKLFGYLQRFGTLQLFLTISPDSSGSFTIAVKSGTVKRAALDDANLQLLPNTAERKRIAGQHPMECARYFERVMDTFINDILGWDTSRCLPRRGGGVFGVVRAFGAAVETQQAGDLHAHFAIWLHGFPQTSSTLHNAFSNNAIFRSRLLQFIDTIVTTDIPAVAFSDKCPKDSGELQSVEVGLEAFRRPIPGKSAPVTSRCTSCRSEYHYKDIINAGIDKTAAECNITLTDGYVDFLKCRAARNEAPCSSEAKLSQTLVIREVQVHFWTHSRSCFKVTSRTPKGSVCRFFKPDSVAMEPTGINSKGDVILHREIGSEYLNPYNVPILTAFKCNHDVRFVFGSDKRSVAAYVCKYCMKMQKKVENQLALSLAAFARGVRSADNMSSSTPPSSRGYRILFSMLYSISNTQEIASTMAALLLRRQSPFWFSHDVIFVNPSNLLSGESVMEDVAVFPEALLTGKKSKLKDRSVVLRQYWARQSELEDTWFAEVCENYVPGATTTGGDRIDFVLRDTRRVLVVAGKPIPDITSQLDAAASDFYYGTLLLLFRPHRQSAFSSSLCDPRQGYQRFIKLGPPEAVNACRRFEEHWQDFHRGQREFSRDESPEQELIRVRNNGCVDERFTHAFGEESDPCFSDDDSNCSDIGALPTMSCDYSIDASLDVAQEVVTGFLNLPDIVDGMSRQYTQRDLFRVPEVPVDLTIDDYLVRVGGVDISEDFDILHGTSEFLKSIPTVRTQIKLFTECFQPVPWQPPENDELNCLLELRNFPTIGETSCAFRLNFWQHAVFEMAARHLLWSYMKDIEDESQTSLHNASTHPYDVKDQLIGYLGGEAGTGKSTVIHALLAFAEKWGRTGTVETTAFTGVAAANINGKTLHTSRNLKVIGYGQRAAPTLQMKQDFRKVVLVIIDEVSMTDRALLGSTDLASQDMACQNGQLMGGKHVLLCGDWLQLPPVKGTPCYVRPNEMANQYHHAGYNLYSAINFVVFLTENMRSQEDPVYAEILASLRWGRTTAQHIDLLNSRVLQNPSHPQHITTSLDFYRPVVVSTNRLRCAINRLMALKTTSDTSQPLYEIQASSSSRSQHIFKRILNANDDLTDGISMRLYVSVGMPVIITRKHPALSKFKEITNGTLATVVGFSPPIMALDSETIETTHGTVHRLYQPPKLIFIHLNGCEKVLVPGLAPGVIGIPVLTEQVKLSKIPNLSQATITVKQFPVVPAFACTTEKLQGKTCKFGVSVSRLTRFGGVPTQTFYVALSRTTTLANLTLTEPLSAEYLAKFDPDPAAATEMMRLMELIRQPPYMSRLEKERFLHWFCNQKVGHI